MNSDEQFLTCDNEVKCHTELNGRIFATYCYLSHLSQARPFSPWFCLVFINIIKYKY